MNNLKRFIVFISLMIFISSLSLIITSLLTNFWYESYPIYKNSDDDKQKNNFVHCGLFNGVRQLDWGLGPRYVPFSGAFRNILSVLSVIFRLRIKQNTFYV